MALTLNTHFGNERDGVNPFPGRKEWFKQDHLAWAFRAEGVTNPGRYLAYAPTSAGFLPGLDNYSLKLWDLTSTFDVMPTDFLRAAAARLR